MGKTSRGIRYQVAALGKWWKAVSASFVVAYLVAIVAANLLTMWLGPIVTPVNAFLFIGLDITARDSLHDAWKHKGLWWKMALLIGSGSILSWLLNRGAGRIALASFVAFACAGIVDALIYSLLGKRKRLERVNWSNIFSAGVDSLVFPSLAFGWPPDAWICYGQFTAKVAGGLFWSLILKKS